MFIGGTGLELLYGLITLAVFSSFATSEPTSETARVGFSEVLFWSAMVGIAVVLTAGAAAAVRSPSRTTRRARVIIRVASAAHLTLAVALVGTYLSSPVIGGSTVDAILPWVGGVVVAAIGLCGWGISRPPEEARPPLPRHGGESTA
jgi:hypothetical protein